jgi:hypothetical protein
MLVRTGSYNSGSSGLQSASPGRSNEAAGVVEGQVMGSQVALEDGTILNLPPWETPAATT